MTRINSILKILFLTLASLALISFNQDTLLSEAPAFAVSRMLPFVSINSTDLSNAKTLLEINPRYNADWVRSYESVKLKTFQHGKTTISVGQSDVFTNEQRLQLASADLGLPITVDVKYMPENNLSRNNLQEMGFSFAVEADVDAQFPGGEAQLLAYLAKNAIDKIPEGTYQGYDLSAVKFTVDVSGSVTEVEIVEPFEDATIEELLHDAVCNMPDWIPAHFNDGTKVAQQFAFTVGNMENCKLPLLNLEGRKL